MFAKENPDRKKKMLYTSHYFVNKKDWETPSKWHFKNKQDKSKIVCLALFPDYITKEMKKPRTFYMEAFSFKTLDKTIKIDYKNGGLKNVDIFFKIASL